jgi:integrase
MTCEILLSQARGVFYETILMALRTGMRQGELKGLEWRSIDLVNRVVIVQHSYCNRKKDIGTPKNKRRRTELRTATLWTVI